jgi:hypothetical protein
VRKAALAAAVAALAAAGLIVALVVSSGGGDSASPAASSAGATPSTASRTTQSGPATTRRTTTAPPSPTAPVDTSSLRLPPPPGPRSNRSRTFLVGVVDDALAQQSAAFARAQVDVSRDAGFDAAAVSATWRRGERRPPQSLLAVLRNVRSAVRRAHMRLFVVLWHGLGQDTPRGAAERADFAAYAGALVEALPGLEGVIVGNEPNLSTFWRPQFGAGGSDVAAVAYTDLLGRSYDAIKAADPDVLVLGGTLSPRGADRAGGPRPTHSPTSFIRDVGTSYRRSRRDRPLMDAFAFHPYMLASRIPPTAVHPQNTSITLADYPKLVALLEQAFRGTAQPGARLPIYYTEFGVQTRVPARKLAHYENRASSARTDSVPFATQAAYYRRALALAYCQPTVRGLFIFHTFDEGNLGGWQSGLYFADRTPKPSLRPFRRAVADLREGRLARCSG